MKDERLVQRKNDHLDIVLDPRRAVTQASAGFERWRFTHCAMPELDFNDITLETTFLNRQLQAPLLISSMTGGVERSRHINRHLAEAAQALKIAMGVGSQRVAIESDAGLGLDKTLRQLAPDVPLLANLGAAQLAGKKGIDYARRAVEMIEADALIVHLNPLQEALQPGGDRDWRGRLAAIETLVRVLPVPLVIKEVGAGISRAVAGQLIDAGVAVIDVAGAGGTSWAAVEGERAATEQQRSVATVFADWGIPTAEALVEIADAWPQVPLIASGGIKNGVDAAKALRLGACMVGQAAAVLGSAGISTEKVIDHFNVIIEQLRVACFCTGSASLSDLKQADIRYLRDAP